MFDFVDNLNPTAPRLGGAFGLVILVRLHYLGVIGVARPCRLSILSSNVPSITKHILFLEMNKRGNLVLG